MGKRVETMAGIIPLGGRRQREKKLLQRGRGGEGQREDFTQKHRQD
jgi:hypothetical protein